MCSIEWKQLYRGVSTWHISMFEKSARVLEMENFVMPEISHRVPHTGWVKIGIPCTSCQSKGTVKGEPCTECSGSGEKVINVTLSSFIQHINQEIGNELRQQGVY